MDILTPAAEKNVDNESFTTRSTRRLSMSFCSSMSSQNDLSSHVEKD